MLARRLRWPQPPVRPCCHLSTTAQRCRESKPPKSSSNDDNDGDLSSTPSSQPAPWQPSPSHTPSLYETLFPTKITPPTPRPRAPRIPLALNRPSKSAQDGRDAKNADLRERASRGNIDVSRTGDELRAWLENAAVELEGEPDEPPTAEKDMGKVFKAGVLILHNVSRSLAESDFHRLASQGKHVAGWNGDLIRVVQAVSDDTREPQGQYFLLFASLDAAEAYRSRIPALLSPPSGDGDSSPPLSPLTLLPPAARLESSVLPLGELIAMISRVGAGLGSSDTPSSNLVPHQLGPQLHASRWDQNLSHCVVVRLAGSKISHAAMREAIEADGAERNLPWRLAARGKIFALAAGRGSVQWGGETETPLPRAQGYTRFVITCADAGEAKRFARVWNKREMVDVRTDRAMVVNATALM